MKNRIVLLIILLFPLLSFSQNNNCLLAFNKQSICFGNIVEKNDEILKVSKKEIEFDGIFKTVYYTKPSPLEIEIMNYEGLKKKIGIKDYNRLNQMKATYSIFQDSQQFNIRSLVFLNIKPNKVTRLKAVLYEIHTQKGLKNLVIIKNIIKKRINK